jgi:hypothetical protein
MWDVIVTYRPDEVSSLMPMSIRWDAALPDWMRGRVIYMTKESLEFYLRHQYTGGPLVGLVGPDTIATTTDALARGMVR